MNKLIDAVRTIRKNLLILDEPIKAYSLLKELNLPELKKELDDSYGLIRPIFEPEAYTKSYDCKVDDAELIEPKEYILNAGGRYARYKWIVDELTAEKPTSYMDLACYIGSLVTTAGGMSIPAVGVDMTSHAIEKARERATEAGLDNVKFYVDDVTKFDKEKADLVSAFEVLEHVVDPKQFIKHISSLANKWAYITTPNGSFDNGRGNLGHWDWDGNFDHTRGHVRVFTKETLFKLITDCGCEVAFLEAMPDQLLWVKFRGVKP